MGRSNQQSPETRLTSWSLSQLLVILPILMLSNLFISIISPMMVIPIVLIVRIHIHIWSWLLSLLIIIIIIVVMIISIIIGIIIISSLFTVVLLYSVIGTISIISMYYHTNPTSKFLRLPALNITILSCLFYITYVITRLYYLYTYITYILFFSSSTIIVGKYPLL